jgi:hypothetical protein
MVIRSTVITLSFDRCRVLTSLCAYMPAATSRIKRRRQQWTACRKVVTLLLSLVVQQSTHGCDYFPATHSQQSSPSRTCGDRAQVGDSNDNDDIIVVCNYKHYLLSVASAPSDTPIVSSTADNVSAIAAELISQRLPVLL